MVAWLCTLGLVVSASAHAQHIYWIQSGSIWRAGLDGREPEFVHQTGCAVALALDPVEVRLYYADPCNNVIAYVDLRDGSEHIFLVSAGGSVDRLSLDSLDRKLYWRLSDHGLIFRSDLDIVDPQLILEPRNKFPYGDIEDIFVSEDEGKLYWLEVFRPMTRRGFGYLARADLDGANIEDLFTTTWSTQFGFAHRLLNLARDNATGAIYTKTFLQYQVPQLGFVVERIERFTPGAFEPVVIYRPPFRRNIADMAVDSVNGMLYILHTTGGGEELETIERVALDECARPRNCPTEVIIDSVSNGRDIIVDPIGLDAVPAIWVPSSLPGNSRTR